MNVWILAARPKTLFAAVAPVLMGTALAHAAGHFHLLSALCALVGAVLIQIGTNFANDYVDYVKGTDTAERLGPLRVTQAGLVSPRTMKRATALVFGLAVLVGCYLVGRGGWPIVVVGLTAILWGYLYTAGPYPLGYHGLGDLFVLVYFGPVAVGGTYYVQALTVTWPVLILGLSPGLFSLAILTVNNLRDIDNDRAAGKKTLAVRFGRTATCLQYVLAVVLGSSIPLFVFLAERRFPWSLLSLIVPVAAIPALRTVFTSREGPVLNNVLATTGKLLLLFTVLYSVGVLL